MGFYQWLRLALRLSDRVNHAFFFFFPSDSIETVVLPRGEGQLSTAYVLFG